MSRLIGLLRDMGRCVYIQHFQHFAVRKYLPPHARGVLSVPNRHVLVPIPSKWPPMGTQPCTQMGLTDVYEIDKCAFPCL